MASARLRSRRKRNRLTAWLNENGGPPVWLIGVPVPAAVDVAESEMQVREFEGEERAEAQRLIDLQLQDINVDIRRAELELAMAEERRVQASLALEECRVKAPKDGTILRILLGPDNLAGQPPAMCGSPVLRAIRDQFVMGVA